MRGSCWLSALLSASYPDVISISLVFGQTQALFSPTRRAKAAVSLDNADAVIDASTARLTHYEKRRIRDSAIPVQGTTPATASWNRLCGSHSNSSRLYEVVDEFAPGARRSGALSREGCVRNVLRDTVMACRKPSEQSLAR